MLLNEFLRVFPQLYAAGNSIEIVSGPGVGKSESMYTGAANLSRTLGQPVGIVTYILSQLEPPDIRGMVFPVRDGDKLLARMTQPTVFPMKWNTRVYVNGKEEPDYFAKGGEIPKHGILFFDEFGQADADIQKPAAQLILAKALGEEKLPGGWVTWAASNRVSDKSGVTRRLRMLQNRIMTLEIVPSVVVWEEWAVRAHIHPLIVSFAKKFPSYVFQSSVPDKDGPFATPRSLVLLGRQLEALREPGDAPDTLPDSPIAVECVQGWLGEATMPIFVSFTKLANEMPDIDDLIKNPKSIKLPDKIDVRYILTMTLANYMKKETAAPIIQFISRLDKELQILFVTTCVRRDPKIFQNAEFQKWVKANKDLVTYAMG